MNRGTNIAGLEQAASLGERAVHLAIGMFDGVHLGHRSVMEAAVASARRTGGIAVALTFDPHPSRVLRPESAVPLLMPPEIKAHRLGQIGAEAVITQSFTREFAAVTADDFVPMLQRAIPTLQSLYVGENWRFGKGRSGDVALLQTQANAKGINVFSAPRVKLDGQPISSTRIRQAAAKGEMQTVNALLGYTYRSEGAIVAGRRLGRTISFPTMNLRWEPECRPRYGVYAVRFGGADEGKLTGRGVANYGLRPTVETRECVRPLLEVHGLDGAVSWDVGDRLAVEWCHSIRAEQRFADIETLKTQIQADVAIAQTLV